MFADLKVYFVVSCVLFYCDQSFSKCKKQSKICLKMGGICYGKKNVPAGATFLGKCKGNCNCYKESVNTTSVTPEELPDHTPHCGFDLEKYLATRGAAGGGSGYLFEKWPGNTVPYLFTSSFTSNDRTTFKAATKQIADATCVKFTEGWASKYLRVVRDCPCTGTGTQCTCTGSCFEGGQTDGLGAASPRWLRIGRACLDPNSQENIGFLVHEILHALGIVHTQKRPDRNLHITVHLNNVPVGKEQFTRCSGCNTFGTPYDCRSIMHYRAWFFVPKNVAPCTPSQQQTCSMTALNPSTCDLHSNNNVLTKSDKDLINKIYNCGTPSPTTKTCQGSCGKQAKGCWCDKQCSQMGDCCPDKDQVCSSATPPPTPTPTPPPTPPPTPAPTSPTCKNNCGSKVTSNGKSCWCDSSCAGYGDCCPDKTTYC